MQLLSNILRLNFCYFKVIHILHPSYYPSVIGRILKNKQGENLIYIHRIMRLIVSGIKMKMKDRLHMHGNRLGTGKNRSTTIHTICDSRKTSIPIFLGDFC